MEISYHLLKRGLSITVDGVSVSITYPQGVFEKLTLPQKKLVCANLVYAKTIPLRLIKNNRVMKYRTPVPVLKPFFDSALIGDIARVNDQSDYMTNETLFQRFLDTAVLFLSNDFEAPGDFSCDGNRALLTMSFGKDSLLSYCLAREMGIPYRLVFIRDIHGDDEMDMKLRIAKRFMKEQGEEMIEVIDRSDELYNDERINVATLEICQSNAMNSFLLGLVPVAHHCSARYIALGNEKNLDYPFMDDEGYTCYYSYEQTEEWTLQQDVFMRLLTGGKLGVISLVKPLPSIAEIKVLYGRYPDIARYQMSCTLDDAADGKKNHWCENCPTCTETYLYLKAFGLDPGKFGLKKDLLAKKFESCFPLFDGEDITAYEKSRNVRDENLLAFYLAYKRGVEGYCMDIFKRRYLKEARRREKRLRKLFLAPHETPLVPPEYRKALYAIFREELNSI
ncbi:MAG: hypothetical protein P9M00_08060 [Candidatus Tritonobacter lacicola]|nr:hypothetical protein [Candidatus Tritonobacter lacicola]